MTHFRTKRILQICASLALAILVFGQGCNNAFEMTPIELGSANSSSLQAQSPFKCSDPNTTQATNMRRLSKAEYSNTVLNLLGPSLHSSLSNQLATFPNDGLYKSVSDFAWRIEGSHMTAYDQIAEQAQLLVSQNLEHAKNLAGTCIADTTVTRICKENFVKKVGLKAFRRPLQLAEVTQLVDVIYPLGTTASESVGWVIYKLMRSPDFAFHVEVGATDGTDSAFRLTSFEIASRLSYFLWDAPPDETLFQAAAVNELQTLEQVSTHYERMLDDTRTRDKIRRFFSFWLDPHSYPMTGYSVNFLAGIANVTNLNAEFTREMNEFIDYIVWTKKGSFSDLLTSTESFARTPEAASIYGHSPAAASAAATMGQGRQGVLMRTPVLAGEGDDTRPILRGVKFRTRILCDKLGFPSGVILTDSPLANEEAHRRYSTRERTTQLTISSSCMGCHTAINPLGFAFENIDSLGRFRSSEKVYSTTGTLVAEHGVNTYVTDLNIEERGPSSVNDGQQLIQELVNGSKAPACFAQQMYRYYNFREETSDDHCVLNEMYKQIKGEELANGSILSAFKRLIVNEAIFTRRTL